MNATDTRRYTAPLDRQGEVIVVVVHRYDKPEDAWGVHELTRRDATPDDPMTYQDFGMMALTGGKRHYKFHQHTVGLFRERPSKGTYSVLDKSIVATAASGLLPNAGNALMMALTIDEIFDYIGAQIIPLEWKTQWAANDPDIRSRVEVWV